MKKKVKFLIYQEQFFNNGKAILNTMPRIEDGLREALSMEKEVELKIRTQKNKEPFIGISANSLNVALRECLIQYGFHNETHVENGTFIHSSKEGFDFSDYDEEHNYAHLYNYYRGAIGIRKGDEKIIGMNKKMGFELNEWKGKIKETIEIVGEDNDYITNKEKLTVVGELQFGNWALLYRDFFRLLDADNNPGVDMYVYVAARNNLSKMISQQTVNYAQAAQVIKQYKSIIKTPIWLIGLDIEDVGS